MPLAVDTPAPETTRMHWAACSRSTKRESTTRSLYHQLSGRHDAAVAAYHPPNRGKNPQQRRTDGRWPGFHVSQTPANGNRHFTTRPGEPRDKVNVPITSFVSVSRTVSIIVVTVTDPTYAAG